jgi:glutaredoxin-related protein
MTNHTTKQANGTSTTTTGKTTRATAPHDEVMKALDNSRGLFDEARTALEKLIAHAATNLDVTASDAAAQTFVCLARDTMESFDAGRDEVAVAIAKLEAHDAKAVQS